MKTEIRKIVMNKNFMKREGNKFILDLTLLSEISPDAREFFEKNSRNFIKTLRDEIYQLYNISSLIKIKGFVGENNISDVRASDIGKFVKIQGMVSRATKPMVLVVSRTYSCPTCGNEIVTSGEFPKRCSCGKISGFKEISVELQDLQEIEVEELQEELGGKQPEKIRIRLVEQLVDKNLSGLIQPGSKVEVPGVIEKIPLLKKKGQDELFEFRVFALDINSLGENFEDENITDEEMKEIEEIASFNPLEQLKDAIAPNIYGYDDIKKSLVLQAVWGVRKTFEDGKVTRDKSHILLVGDGGLAKTELGKNVQIRTPKSYYVAGESATGIGISATVVKDELTGSWSVRCGAFPKATGSTCVHPNTKVLIDGNFIEISKFSSQNIFQPKNSFTPSLDKNKILKNKLNLFSSKNYKGNMVKITLNSGLDVICTPNHEILDGMNLSWKKAEDFKVGDYFLSNLEPTKIKNKIRLIDIIPQEIKIILDKTQKQKLRKELLKKFKNIREINKYFLLNKNFFCGRSNITIKKYKEILKLINKDCSYLNFKLNNNNSKQINLYFLNENLSYLVGFIRGDGNVSINNKKNIYNISIIQSKIHQEYINKIFKVSKKIFKKIPSYCITKANSNISHSNKISNKNGIIQQPNDIIQRCLTSKILSYVCLWYKQNFWRLSNENLIAYLSGLFDADGCVSVKNYKKNNKPYQIQHAVIQISNDYKENQNIVFALKRLGIFSKIIPKKNFMEISITNKKDVEKLCNLLEKQSKKIKNRKKLKEKKKNIGGFSDIIPSKYASEISKEIYQKIKTPILLKLGVHSTLYAYKYNKRVPRHTSLDFIYNKLKNKIDINLKKKFETILNSKFYSEKIVQIEKIPYNGLVYDLAVPKPHNFIANSFVVHNCIIDEIDKLSEEDRKDLHTPMESGIIPLNKAGISTILPADCAVLAIANPKGSMFDFGEGQTIVKQINMAPTLLDRFDLIFVMRDKMDEKQDKEVAKRVFSGTTAKSKISVQLFRKYVTLARRLKPKFPNEFEEEVSNFYTEIRKKSKIGNQLKGKPITARFLQGVIRFAEAHAKLRLSKIVEKKDLEVSKGLFYRALVELGMDETGLVDTARMGEGRTLNKKNKIRFVLEIFKELIEDKEDKILKNEILKEKCIEKGFDDFDYDDVITILNKENMIIYTTKGWRLNEM